MGHFSALSTFDTFTFVHFVDNSYFRNIFKASLLLVSKSLLHYGIATFSSK